MKNSGWLRLRRRGGEAGAGGEALELAIILPAFLVLFGAIVAIGRFQIGSSSIDQAAGAAARAASLQATASGAFDAALDAADASLAAAGATCEQMSIDIDTSGFSAMPGDRADVLVTLTCNVPWSDLSIPGWPGVKTISASAASPLDTRRIGT